MALAVLLVDDSAPVRDRLTTLLTAVDGVSVIQASGLAGARDVLTGHEPDVLVVDVRMPDGSGIDLVRELRATGRLTVSIVLTNHMLPPYREMSLAAGASFFLDKSTEYGRLVDIVSGMVQNQRCIR